MTESLLAAGWWEDFWPETGRERRQVLVLLIIGAVVSGWAVYAMYKAIATWREHAARRARRRLPPDTPRYLGAAPAGGTIALALGVGALRAVASGEPVDHVDYRRPAREVRAELYELLDAAGSDAREREARARSTLPPVLRALLGGKAETVAPGLALAEEALRQRNRVGPELWHHALEEYATARGLQFDERQGLLNLAQDIGHAEEQLRMEGVLGGTQETPEQVPSLLAVHWAQGVHLVRCAARLGWLAAPQAHEYLDRAGALVAGWYPVRSTMLAALLLPAMLSDDTSEARRGITVARQLLTDLRSPLAPQPHPQMR